MKLYKIMRGMKEPIVFLQMKIKNTVSLSKGIGTTDTFVSFYKVHEELFMAKVAL
jgi:hypothetical protein